MMRLTCLWQLTSVLLCSGLDATTAMHLLTTFRQLAEGGRAILTTIHQPSSRLYRQLDNVLLLSEGHVMYYGAAKLALDWFAHLKYPCPYGVNIADFMLDLANGDMEAEGRCVRKAPFHSGVNVLSGLMVLSCYHHTFRLSNISI